MAPLKEEVEDSLEEEHVPLQKRHKFQQQRVGTGGFTVPASQYNPLDEPSPLGLRLRKSPSLLELIQMKLSQGNTPEVRNINHDKKEPKCSTISIDKMKASNFPALILKVGTWEYKSRYEGDLVVKCYFAKHKLVWEVLDGGLKNKIEIQWSDIVALKAKYLDDGPGTLNVVLSRQPLFFRETNPQPRKHTLWQATSDFTGGQASIHRQHFLECPQGLLGKHFEKLIQCDPRLSFLSQQEEMSLDSPYFEPRLSVLDDPTENKIELDLNRESSPFLFSLQDTTSPSGPQSSSKDDQDALARHSGSYPRETPSPCSAGDELAVIDIESGGMEQLKELNKWDQIKVPGLRSSMSISDLISHLEHRISEPGSSPNTNLSNEDWESLQILDSINRHLLSDNHSMPSSDEKGLMSRVNSLCCLLQKDTVCSNTLPVSENCPTSSDEPIYYGLSANKNQMDANCVTPDDDSHGGSFRSQAANMPKNDSVGDLLLNLPRIASLPQFLFNISEDCDNQAR